MELPQIRVEFDDAAHLERELEANLRHGGTFVAGVTGLIQDDDCEAVLVHPAGGSEMVLSARVVFVGSDGERDGTGIAFSNFDGELREQLRVFAAGGAQQGQSSAAVATEQQSKVGDSPHERVRGLSLAEAHKLAGKGELGERVALERVYGKAVWEPLLRNPRLTIPEVARIARMGGIPIPLLELVVANGGWMSSASVRRSLLGNPRLGGEMLNKVLRSIPRHELKLVYRQTTYSVAVRNAARKILGI